MPNDRRQNGGGSPATRGSRLRPCDDGRPRSDREGGSGAPRDARRGDHLVDRNVNYTNVCITDCTFCEFYRKPGDREAYVLPKDAMRTKLSELRAAGGTRVLLQGGHNPDLRIGWYEDLLRFLSEEFPDIRPDAFSPPRSNTLRNSKGYRRTTCCCASARRDSRVSRVEAAKCSTTRSAVACLRRTMTAERLRIMGEAHELGLSTTVTMVFGFGEEIRHRCNAFAAIRDRQDLSLERFGRCFVGFASWPLQHESRYGELWGLKRA
jgi:cyclic dehypoxanthinyl futalosine synthase